MRALERYVKLEEGRREKQDSVDLVKKSSEEGLAEELAMDSVLLKWLAELVAPGVAREKLLEAKTLEVEMEVEHRVGKAVHQEAQLLGEGDRVAQECQV